MYRSRNGAFESLTESLAGMFTPPAVLQTTDCPIALQYVVPGLLNPGL